MKKLVFIITCWLAIGAQAQAVDFDCAKARSTFEHVICGKKDAADRSNLTESQRQELINLEKELNAVYRDVLAQYFDPALLHREQLVWLKARDRCVRDAYCPLFDLYHDRIDSLRDDMAHPPKTSEEQENTRLLSMGLPPGDNFRFSRDATNKGYGFGVCEAMVRWINHTTPKGEMNEPYRTVTSMPNLVEPAWHELDIQQHKELFAKLVESIRVNAPAKAVRKEIEDELAGSYRLWTVKEDVYMDSKLETLVMFTRKNAPLSEQYWGSPQIVTDDLRDVDKQANINVMSHGGMLLRFKGKPYFISADAMNSFVSGHTATCEINNFRAKGNKK